MFVTVQRSLL